MQSLNNNNFPKETQEWSNKDLQLLEDAVHISGHKWETIAIHFFEYTKTSLECENKYCDIIFKLNEIVREVRKDKWNEQDEQKLIEGVTIYKKNWKTISSNLFNNNKSPLECSNKYVLINKIQKLHQQDNEQNIDYEWDKSDELKLIECFKKREFDWKSISNIDFNNAKSPIECQKKYIYIAKKTLELQAESNEKQECHWWSEDEIKNLLDTYEEARTIAIPVNNKTSYYANRNKFNRLRQKHVKNWTTTQRQNLEEDYEKYKSMNNRWDIIGKKIGKTPLECQLFFIDINFQKSKLEKHVWSDSETNTLLNAVEQHGAKWTLITKKYLVNFTTKMCKSKFYKLKKNEQLWSLQDRLLLEKCYSNYKSQNTPNYWKKIAEDFNTTEIKCKIQCIKAGIIKNQKRTADELEFKEFKKMKKMKNN